MKRKNKIIAFQGIHGAHSEVACRSLYPEMETRPVSYFEDVFDAVENGTADLGLIPIENSKAGRVAEIHMLLPYMNLYIVGEHFQKIEHHLLAPLGTTLDSVKHVYSHAQALLQCRDTIRHLGFIPHSYSDTAQAAADVSAWNDPSKAALASDLAAQHYNLALIKPNMEDSKDNTTLFLTIAKEALKVDPGSHKIVTSIFFETRNIPAALYKALGGFATNNVNLLKLESYIPGKTSQRALFFATFEDHISDVHVRNALDELHFFCENVRILGSYPADTSRFL
jgi:prephenate dehydratase